MPALPYVSRLWSCRVKEPPLPATSAADEPPDVPLNEPIGSCCEGGGTPPYAYLGLKLDGSRPPKLAAPAGV